MGFGMGFENNVGNNDNKIVGDGYQRLEFWKGDG